MAKETSIWGDLDLKAVARDVESQTGSLAEEQPSVAGEVQVSEDAAIITVQSAPQPLRRRQRRPCLMTPALKRRQALLRL